MTQFPSADPVHALLDLPAHARDDRSLLGLPPQPCGKAEVIAALRTRLALVASHPLGATPQASEVRMLLHAAATRLLLGAEVTLSPPAAPREQHAGAAQSAPVAPPSAPASEFEHAAILTLAMHGGWNKASLHRLRLVAQSAGVPAHDFISAIRALMQRPWAGGRAVEARATPPASPRTIHAPAASPLPSANRAAQAHAGAEPDAEPDDAPSATEDPGRTIVKRIVIGSAAFIVALIVLVVGLRIMLRPAPKATTPPLPSSAAPVPPSNSAANPVAAPALPAQPRPSDETARERTPVDPAAVVEAVRSLAADDSASALSPEALERAYTWSAVRWTDASPAQLASLVDAWGELAYRLPASASALSHLASLIDADLAPLTQPPTQWTAAQVRRAAWAATLAQRLGSEPELDTRLRSPLRRSAQAALGPLSWDRPRRTRDALLATLQALARRALASENASLPEPAPTWAIWSAGVAHIRGMSTGADEAGAAQDLALDTIDRALAHAADATSPALSAPIAAAAAHIDLANPSNPARARVLEWLGDERLTQADVSVLMSALASRPEHGLDASMTIAALGDPAQREQVRTRLASAWRMPVGATASSAARDRWRQASGSVLLANSPAGTPADHFAAIPRLALLNLAAHQAWEGDASAADATLSQLASISLSASTSGPGASRGAAALEIGTTWGQRYLLAGNNTLTKLELLRAAASPPSPLEARLIVQEAINGSTVEVRREGLRLLELHAGSINIAVALLNAGHRLPPVREISAVVERVTAVNLPAPRDPAWRVAARRALVVSILARLRTDDASAIDLASSMLADAYAQRAGRTVGQDADAAAEVAGVRAALASRARALWQPPWDRLSVETADALLAQRRRAARGPLQLTVAEQVSVVEHLAILTAAERESARDELSQVLAQLRAALADAEHVAQQVTAAELAQARVWALRMGAPTP